MLTRCHTNGSETRVYNYILQSVRSFIIDQVVERPIDELTTVTTIFLKVCVFRLYF